MSTFLFSTLFFVLLISRSFAAECQATLSSSFRLSWVNNGVSQALNDITITNTGVCPITEALIEFLFEPSETILSSWNLNDINLAANSAKLSRFGGYIQPNQVFTGSGFIVDYNRSVSDGKVPVSLLLLSCVTCAPSGFSEPGYGFDLDCTDSIILINSVQNKTDTSNNPYFYNHGIVSNTAYLDVAWLTLKINTSGGPDPFQLAQLTREGSSDIYQLSWSNINGDAIPARTTAEFSFDSLTLDQVSVVDCGFVGSNFTSSGFCSTVTISQKLVTSWENGGQDFNNTQWTVSVTNNGLQAITSLVLQTGTPAAESLVETWSVTVNTATNQFSFPSWITNLAISGVWQFGLISKFPAEITFAVVSMTCA